MKKSACIPQSNFINRSRKKKEKENDEEKVKKKYWK